MKKILSIVILCAVAASAAAKPAYRGPIVRTAADGNEQVVYLHGNEDFHYMTDAAGRWLDATTLRPISEEAKSERLKARSESRKVRGHRAPQQTEGVGEEPNIAPRGLLILVNFQDVKFSTPNATVDNMLNGDNFTRDYSYVYSYRDEFNKIQNETIQIQSEGSARKYFEAQSYGQYSPVFDVVGPVTMSHNMAYYGENNDDNDGSDKRPVEMIAEACKLADSELGVDFTRYDNDNDGYVDFVYVIYAGYGEADGAPANTIWPHQYNLTYAGTKCIVDGLTVDRYACGSELSYVTKQYDGIGTFCHEFSHVLGLPDLYPTGDDNSHKTLGEWDIMDYGPYNNYGNTPPAYSAYERFYMGWLTPRVLSDKEYVWLNPINYGKGYSILLCEGDSHNMTGWDPNPTTFYMVEARTKNGWDSYLPGEGLLITKIQYSKYTWKYNVVNNNSRSMCVDLIEADGSAPTYNQNNPYNGFFGKSTDAFPAGASEWTGFAGHEITNISVQEGGAVTFSYRGAAVSALDEAEDGKKAHKILRNGQIYMIYKGQMYDVQGRRIENW
ncbi:MAG: M6 family metalloprotease domain-containing protein [Paludibacteraceae bacterium]|nr:M6 family metalloprotease domain-containing protein [Paludibacteraceae bacterium]